MKLDKNELKSRSNDILTTIASSEFLECLSAIKKLPKNKRIEAAAKSLTPDAMRKAGMSLPEHIRISSRYFEEGEDFEIELGDPEGRIPVVPAITEVHPEFLDQLREKNPDLFRQIVSHPRSAGGDVAFSVCLCVGGGICAGVGGGD